MRDPIADRRPIAARRLRASAAAAGWLARRGASPNAISVAGMVAGLLAGAAFATARVTALGHPALWLAGAALVLLRLLANMLDGMVAVQSGRISRLGELFNEVPDRVSDVAVLLGLGVAAGRPALGLAAALAALATAYIRALGKAAGQPSDYGGPMAKQQRMAVAVLVALWCAATPPAWSAPAPAIGLVLVAALATLTAALRLARLARALAGAA